MAEQDALAPLLALADAAKKAKEITAEAIALMNSAKMAKINADSALKDANDRQDALDAVAAKLELREAAINARGDAQSATAAQQAEAAKALAAREKECAANEARLANALAEASAAREQAISYEGQAYAKLEAVRKKLVEAEAL